MVLDELIKTSEKNNFRPIFKIKYNGYISSNKFNDVIDIKKYLFRFKVNGKDVSKVQVLIKACFDKSKGLNSNFQMCNWHVFKVDDKLNIIKM